MQLIEKISVRQLTGFPSNELIDEFHLLRLHEQQPWLALALQDANGLLPSVRYWPTVADREGLDPTLNWQSPSSTYAEVPGRRDRQSIWRTGIC